MRGRSANFVEFQGGGGRERAGAIAIQCLEITELNHMKKVTEFADGQILLLCLYKTALCVFFMNSANSVSIYEFLHSEYA